MRWVPESVTRPFDDLVVMGNARLFKGNLQRFAVSDGYQPVGISVYQFGRWIIFRNKENRGD